MAAYPTVTSVLQGGNVNQALGNEFLLSGAQPSLENVGGFKNIQFKETLVAMPNECGVTNISDRVIIQYPVLGGQNVSNVNYFNQNTNVLSTSSVNSSNVIVHGNGPTGFVTSSSHLNQMMGNIHDNQATNVKEGTRNVEEGSSNNVNNNVQKGPCTNVPVIGTAIATVPAPTLVKLNNDSKEKIGSLKIHMSESFLPGSIVSYKGILDLNFMRNLFEITNVDISFVNNIPFEPGICDALKQIIYNTILQDWIMLKCEEKQIQFFKVNDQIHIYCVNSFMAALGTVAQESSLPLPFITKDSENNTKYYCINFEKGTNDRVKKLNSLIFYDAENGRKKIPCRYPGIRLDCNFETSVAGFTIHVHESAMPIYKNSVSYIRQLIIYSHIVWGFLQAWILNVREHYNSCFTTADISKNLILNQTSEINALTGNDDGMMYFIGYSNFYLKFDPVLLKETKTTFSIENFETSFACDVSLVQYYRQFILINDLHYSDALKNIILFSKKNEKNGSSTRKNSYLPRKTSGNFEADCFQPLLSSNDPHSFKQKNLTHTFTNVQSVPSSNKAGTSGLALCVQSDPRKSHPGLESNSTYARNIGNTRNEPQQPQTTADSGRPGLTRPLIKTRTVNEINSLWETSDGVGFHRVSFHNEKMPDPTGQERKEISASALAVMIGQILKKCYATNSLVITNQDDSIDPEVICKKFDEAVKKAMGSVTLESFIEKIYVELLLSFTNTTAQKLLNSLIGRAIGVKYPALKGKFLVCFENARKELKGTNKTQAGNPAASTTSEPQEKVKQQIFLLISRDIAVTKPNFIVSNCFINRNTALVQTTKSIPTNLATVAPIISGQSFGQQNSYRAEIGRTKTTIQSSLVQTNLPTGFNVSKRQCPLEPYESRNKSAHGREKLNQSSSSTQTGSPQRTKVPVGNEISKRTCVFDVNVNTDRKNKVTHNVSRQVSVSPNMFRRSEEPKVATVNPSVVQNPSNDSMENISASFSVNSQCQVKTNELVSAPVPLITPLCQLKTSVDIEKATDNVPLTADSCQDNQDSSLKIRSHSDDMVKDLPPVTKEKIFDRYKLKTCSVVLNADDVSNYFKMREKRNEMEEVDVVDVVDVVDEVDEVDVVDVVDVVDEVDEVDEVDVVDVVDEVDVVDVVDVVEEVEEVDVAEEVDVVDKMNEVDVADKMDEVDEVGEVDEVDSSSDASNDSSFQFNRKNSRKRDSLSEDPDFYDSVSRKGIKRRKGVSELEYMEARTRVLQRLRKRSAMYIGWTKSMKMTSDELDNFFVRRKSFVGRSPYVENSTDDEDAGDQAGQTEEVKENGFTQNGDLKKELRVMLVRLEDTPEYKKYKDRLELDKKKSKMIRMGDKTETDYEHILNKKKQYFELIDGKLYLKEQYCVQDGVIVPAGVRSENSESVTFKKEPQSPENEGNLSTSFIKEENNLD